MEPNYLPAVGFLQRAGFTRVNPEVGYTTRFRDHPWLRSLQSEVDLEFYNDRDNRALSRQLALRPATLEFNDGSELAIEITPEYERLDEDFEISDGVILPIGGEYRHTRYQVSGETADHYPVSAGAEVTFGDFFSGTRQEYTVALGVRPRRGVALALEAERNVLNLAEGSFDTDLVRLMANTQFSPWISLVNNVQYDTVSRLLGWQLRFRWIQKPGNDLFLVYTHNWQEGADRDRPNRLSTLDNRLATKLVYTLRF